MGNKDTNSEKLNKKQLNEVISDFINELLKTQNHDSSTEIINSLKNTISINNSTYGFATPYINSISLEEEEEFPGDLKIENQIKSINRWNAMAMVVKANTINDGIGGHISSYASSAGLYEVGFNHFFRGGDGAESPDIIYFQGHASPGIYARAYLEGRLSASNLHNFRQDLAKEGGVTSYPHPYIMPDFWQFPTVSMGLGPIMAVYHARFNRYLIARGLLKKENEPRIWNFIGDGEMDEPESIAGLTMAAREKLDNITWIVNCNLQRLDGPVRGNFKIIQEFESLFLGAGWNVIKLIWGRDWDELLKNDHNGLLRKRMEEAVDGDFQKYSVEPGSYTRQHFFGKYPELLDRVDHLSDMQIHKMLRGGHDTKKIYNAYKKAIEHKGQPTVILAKTIKGYGLGEAGEGRNITHQQKKLNERELRSFKNRFKIPLDDEAVVETPFYRPEKNSKVIKYLKERRKKLKGYLPKREIKKESIKLPKKSLYENYLKGSGDNAASTTMVTVRLLADLLKDKNIGKRIVPIIPDEARTFGMDALFRQFGIYSSKGQLYEPVDSDNYLYYREAKDGQIIEEGITEAGSMSSFIAAGTSYANHGINMIPFFVLYSMFGFQRIADLIWAACDSRSKGFIFGATYGRTSLNGEGLQHQDGHSHLIASSFPTLKAYDPAFAYEIAVIMQEGLKEMYKEGKEIIYYITLYNENLTMPELPKNDSQKNIEEGIIKGIYKFEDGKKDLKTKINLFGSGSIMNEVIKAKKILEEDFEISVNIWSVTSYKALRNDAIRVERENRFNASSNSYKPRKSFLQTTLEKNQDDNLLTVAVSDSIKLVQDQIAPDMANISSKYISLGTDGFGLSDTRENLRDYFEIDSKHISHAVLYGLLQEGKIGHLEFKKFIKQLKIDPKKKNPNL